MQKLIQLITGLLLVLVTGVFWGTWFSLSRTINQFPPDVFIMIGKQIIKNVAVPMSIIMPASIIGLIILLLMSWKTKPPYFYCILITLALFVIALVVTLAIEVPIDNQVKEWTVTTMPADWSDIRDKWECYHTVRTFASISGILFFIVGIQNMKKNEPAK